MQVNSQKVLEYMEENREKMDNHFSFLDFVPLGFPNEYLEIYLNELEQCGKIKIDRQWVQPSYSLI